MEMEPPPPLILPDEVWGTVFTNVDAKDALNFRLVCSAWRRELDTHYDKWTVRLDQTSPYFDHCLQLKVKEANIVNLLTPVDTDEDEGSPTLFKYPELLEKLSIGNSNPNIEPPICPENLLLLLKKCCRSLKYLAIEFDDLDKDNYLTTNAYALHTHDSYNLQPNGLDFRSLEILRLELFYPRPIQEPSFFNMIIGRSTMRKIKSLRLSNNYMCINVTTSTILAFIQKNGRRLEEIICNVYPTFDDNGGVARLNAQPAIKSVDLDLLGQVLRLKKFKILYYTAGQNQEEIPWDMELVKAWSVLLKVQKHLTHLNLSGLPISIPTLQLACTNSQNTLVKIKLEWYTSLELDLAILADCVNLKKLCIVIEMYHGGVNNSILRNVRVLPVGLEKFETYGCAVVSEDILDFFIAHKELVEISLKDSGCSGPYGVTASAFARYITDRNLSDRLRKMKIRGFNIPRVEDLAFINDIFPGLMIRSDMNLLHRTGIRLKRTKEDGGQWSVWEAARGV